MNPTDRYFTDSIIGTPVTLPLGRRTDGPSATRGAISIELHRAVPRVSEWWTEHLLVREQAPVGEAWPRPGRARRWLVRHSIWLAVLGWGLALFLLAERHAPTLSPWLAPLFG